MKSRLNSIILIPLALLATTSMSAQISPSTNFISLDVSTLPENESFNYDSCFNLGAELGMSSVGIYQNWTAIETAPSTFNMELFDIINFYYPLQNMAIDLTIAPIHTNNLEVPEDLYSSTFDSPEMISRFKLLLDSIQAHIPDVTLSSLIIGSEHDAYLGNNSKAWAAYTTFYAETADYARFIWPDLKVASELMFSGITDLDPDAQSLNEHSDYIGVSYYPMAEGSQVKPLTTIPLDFAELVSLYPEKPICFYQYGYPSSPTCGSSTDLQADFIIETFNTWDNYADNVKMIDFTWLHDLSQESVDFYGDYYGIDDEAFLEFLRSLGLRSWEGEGSDKPALDELRCQAKQRGYNSLNMLCDSRVGELSSSSGVSVFPVPCSQQFTLEIHENYIGSEAKVVSQLGDLVKVISNINESKITVDVSKLADGVYFLFLETTDDNYSLPVEKIIVKN